MSQIPLDSRAYAEMKDIMEEVLPELLKTFLDYMPEQLTDLNQAIENNDADLIFGIAHRMKSSCNSLGALGLATIAQSIEMAGRSGSTEGVRELSTQLEEGLNEVMDFFKEELTALS